MDNEDAMSGDLNDRETPELTAPEGYKYAVDDHGTAYLEKIITPPPPVAITVTFPNGPHTTDTEISLAYVDLGQILIASDQLKTYYRIATAQAMANQPNKGPQIQRAATIPQGIGN